MEKAIINSKSDKQRAVKGMIHTVYIVATHICIIIIITIITTTTIPIVTFTQGIYNYIPATNRVYMVHNVAAVLYLQSMLHAMLLPMMNVLYFYISTSRSLCAAPSMAVCCSSFISCFPGTLLRYCLSDSVMVPVAPVITGINCAFTFHMR